MAEGSTSSSLTSTSQTLSFVPGMAAQLPRYNGAEDVGALFDALRPGNRHAFLQPPRSIPTGSLQVVKDTLDAFAGQISDEQLQRLKAANKNKKRKREEALSTSDVLKIRKVHLDGFETGQVWQQARRIIQSTLSFSEEALLDLVEQDEVVMDDDSEDDQDISAPEDDDSESGSEDIEGEEDLEGLEEDESDLAEDDLDEQDFEGALDGDDDELLDDLEEADDAAEEEDDEDEDDADEYVEDPNGLNDGFFSIDDFNKQTQWFEEQDAKGDPNTDAASDDEDINWDVDPLAASSKAGGKSSKLEGGDVDGEAFGLEQEDDDDEEDDEDGPTFGNMDLNAPEGESEDEDMDDEEEEDDGGNNANDIFYKDFFAPPSKKGSKDGQKKKSRFLNKPIQDEDVERAMGDVRRDLFEDESDHGEDSEDALSEVSAGDPRSRRSAHERRQAKLSEEIRKLEAAAVAKREWTLAGEATGVDRPVNSLLEQDLDFEHAGKPVPVVTQETTDSIEELVKRRILAREFDEVLRRRPDAASVSASTRRGLIELDDTKSGKGLAEVYEEEHQKQLDPDGQLSKKDEKLLKEEAEISRMWKDLNATLDALSSWSYRPRPQEPTLSVVTDTATITMEDVQPATAQGVTGGDSTLAPQEVYKAGGKDTVQKGEVVAKSGLPMAKAEMTREDKQRRRRREKERVRKAGADANGKKPASKRAQMQKETMADLKKGGVKVINRKGEVVDMDGNKAKTAHKISSSGFKL